MNDIREAPRGVTIQPGRHAGPSLNRVNPVAAASLRLALDLLPRHGRLGALPHDSQHLA